MCFLGNSVKDAFITNWIMYEYALADKPLAPFVVCRVFDCPPRKDLDSEFGVLSDVEEGNNVGDDSDVAQKPKGAGSCFGDAVEEGDASNFTSF
ncbi:hypothetical protein MTR_1g047060 [Medicago truncatula]|uniref:NAC domain-containing protein n=1 Tax=Medicago truncatula TaxID=3880 RepID=A0A072VIG0_MEDTR|nr:hypothetical protein MTR_1g047060 [Medicago truncatula]